MSESAVLTKVATPNTRASLARDLSGLGLRSGMTVIVHSSLSALGWVCGGPVAVVQALMDVLTSDGTLVMPTHSSGYTDPANWRNPPVPQDWWETIREMMPAFDPKITPTAYMGVIAETFRSFAGVKRSMHPAVSFAAWGKNADFIVQDHKLDYSLGDSSPLGRIYDLDGRILLLGAGHDANTSIHLAESRLTNFAQKMEGGPIFVDSKRVWVSYRDFDYDSDDFEKAGIDFEASRSFSTGRVGASTSRLFSQREIVDFSIEWLSKNRSL